MTLKHPPPSPARAYLLAGGKTKKPRGRAAANKATVAADDSKVAPDKADDSAADELDVGSQTLVYERSRTFTTSRARSRTFNGVSLNAPKRSGNGQKRSGCLTNVYACTLFQDDPSRSGGSAGGDDEGTEADMDYDRTVGHAKVLATSSTAYYASAHHITRVHVY